MKSKTASFLSIRSHTPAAILFRTVFIVVGWDVSFWALDWGIFLFTPAFGKLFVRDESLRSLIAIALRLLVLWTVILLPERRSWADVGWTRRQVSSSLLFGGLIGSCVWLFYVGIIAACGWYWIVGHYAWSHIPMAAFVSLLNSLGWETLYLGYLLKSLEQKQGSGFALIIAAVMYSLERSITNLVRVALNQQNALTFGLHDIQSIIEDSAMGLFYGAVYLWSQRFWTAVGVFWGCTCMYYLLIDHASDRTDVAVFRYSLAPHSFDLTGIGYITEVSIFIIAGVVMAYLAKRRRNWLAPTTSLSQRQ